MSSADYPDDPFDPVNNPQPQHEDALLISARRCALALKYLEFLSRSWNPVFKRFNTIIPEQNPLEFNTSRAAEVLKSLQLWAADGVSPVNSKKDPWWSGLHTLNLPFQLLGELFNRNQHPGRFNHAVRFDISAFFDPFLWQSTDLGSLTATPEAKFKAECLRKFFQGFVDGGPIRLQHLF